MNSNLVDAFVNSGAGAVTAPETLETVLTIQLGFLITLRFMLLRSYNERSGAIMYLSKALH